jgi:hypothetical protein
LPGLPVDDGQTGTYLAIGNEKRASSERSNRWREADFSLPILIATYKIVADLELSRSNASCSVT